MPHNSGKHFHVQRKIIRAPGKNDVSNGATKGSGVHSSVNTFLPGFGSVWLKCGVVVNFWGGRQNILRVILGT